MFLNWFSTRVSDDRSYVCGRRLYECVGYTKILRPRFERNYLTAKDKKTWWEHGASFQSSPKNKPHAQHKIHLPTVTVCNTRPVSLFIIIILLFFFLRPPKSSRISKQSTFSSNRLRGQNRSGKALNLTFLRKTCLASVKQQFLFPVSAVSTRNAWDNNRLFVH